MMNVQKVYLGGEVSALNYNLLTDYNITHVVLCSRHHSCAHAPHVSYMKIPPDSDFVTQVKAFVSFVESLSRSNYTVLLLFFYSSSPFSFILIHNKKCRFW